tara:strand:- start:877 stop:1275 length:399 start_codon:yes stop_codon:yes gene_type:complete
MRLRDGRAIPNFLLQALSRKDLTIYGDGEQTRSFCYVDDLIKGIYALLNSEINLPVNIGNPIEFSVQELAEKILNVTGSSSTIAYCPLPKDDPKMRRPDITQAKERLSWEPHVMLEEGLFQTIKYFEQKIRV